jgi:hypothetical protein
MDGNAKRSFKSIHGDGEIILDFAFIGVWCGLFIGI